MTILIVILLAAAGYAAYKINKQDIPSLKEAASEALDKIEPATKEAVEVKEVKEVAPKAKATTKAKKTK